jgi:hypothetical protein
MQIKGVLYDYRLNFRAGIKENTLTLKITTRKNSRRYLNPLPGNSILLYRRRQTLRLSLSSKTGAHGKQKNSQTEGKREI